MDVKMFRSIGTKKHSSMNTLSFQILAEQLFISYFPLSEGKASILLDK